MADVRPTRENGLLVTSAIRVLRHKLSKPPDAAMIAELLEWGSEKTHAALFGLVSNGVLSLHETPFEAYYEIIDYLKIEDLPAEAEQDALQDEVDEFKRESESKQDQLNKMFESDDVARKKKESLASLEDEFAKFTDQSHRFPR